MKLKNSFKKIIKSVMRTIIPSQLRKKFHSLLNMPEQARDISNKLDVLSNISQQFEEVKKQNNTMSYELGKIKTILLLKEQSPELLHKFASGLINDEKLIDSLSKSLIFSDIQNDFRLNAGIFNQFFIDACVPFQVVKENLISMMKNPITSTKAFFYLVKIFGLRYQDENAILDRMYDSSFCEIDHESALLYINTLLLRKDENRALAVLVEYLSRYELESVDFLPVADLAHRNGFTNENIEAASGLFQTIMKNVETDLFGSYIKKYGNNVTIAIVGNGPHELGLGRGKEIDAHDIVIRCNVYNNSQEYVKDYGSKTDIIIHGVTGQDFYKLYERKPDLFISKFLFGLHCNHTIIQKYKETQFTNVTTFELSAANKNIQDRYNILWPTTGLFVIYYLKKILNFNIAKSDIYGTALTTGRVIGGHYENKNLFEIGKIHWHDLGREFEALMDIFGEAPNKY